MQRRSSSAEASSNGGALRSKGRGGRNDEETMLSSPSSTTDEEESQSLWQSSGTRGGVRGYLRVVVKNGVMEVAAAAAGGRGPLKDSTVLLIPLEVGL